ncbi:MAG: selenide, water dikinase SelD, partial [Spirochaetaceae bacterium]|nr:selenide, water dikinase SelD [Spirochaetaceae bacterium]
PGHSLILTKPLGAGIVMAALRVGMAGDAAAGAAVASMERLNRYAAECMAGFSISACTDITGFGLLVHALEMAAGSATVVLYPDALPALPQAADYANEYLVTAAGQRNRNRAEGVTCVDALPFAVQELLFDPQTSGGLLIAVDSGEAGELVKRIREAGDTSAAVIGEVAPKSGRQVAFR